VGFHIFSSPGWAKFTRSHPRGESSAQLIQFIAVNIFAIAVLTVGLLRQPTPLEGAVAADHGTADSNPPGKTVAHKKVAPDKNPTPSTVPNDKPSNNPPQPCCVYTPANQSNEDTEIQRKIKGFTFWLMLGSLVQAVALIIQAIILRYTLKMIGRQALLMAHHARSLVHLTRAARDNAEAASNNAMAAQSLAGHAQTQASELGNLAAAANRSAEAALLNAQALINVERPWMLIEYEERMDAELKGYSFYAINKGETPAEIVEAYFERDILDCIPDNLPLPPRYRSPIPIPKRGDNFILKDEKWYLNVAVHIESWLENSMKRDAVMNAREFPYFYGVVVYRDILHEGTDKTGMHYSRWCFVYNPFFKTLIPTGPQEYRNKS
jgi:hypothetical protein